MLVWSLIIFALYFLGVNALLFCLLRGVNKEGGSDHATNHNEALGFIYLKYKDEYRNWELVLNFRKCLVVVAQIFLSHTGTGQALMTIGALLLTILAHVVCDEASITSIESWSTLEKRGPYRRESSNTLELRLLLLELLLLVVALVFDVAEVDDDIASGPLLLIVGVAFALIFGELKKRRDERESPKDSEDDPNAEMQSCYEWCRWFFCDIKRAEVTDSDKAEAPVQCELAKQKLESEPRSEQDQTFSAAQKCRRHRWFIAIFLFFLLGNIAVVVTDDYYRGKVLEAFSFMCITLVPICITKCCHIWCCPTAFDRTEKPIMEEPTGDLEETAAAKEIAVESSNL